MLNIAFELIIGIWLVNTMVDMFFDINIVDCLKKIVKRLVK